jgi:hypothetical protein
MDGWVAQLMGTAPSMDHVGADTGGPKYNCSGRLDQHGSRIGGPGGLLLLPTRYLRDHV